MIRNNSDKRLGIQAMTVAMDFKKVSARNNFELIESPLRIFINCVALLRHLLWRKFFVSLFKRTMLFHRIGLMIAWYFNEWGFCFCYHYIFRDSLPNNFGFIFNSIRERLIDLCILVRSVSWSAQQNTA